MFQPTHILRKDAQHLWPELTLHTLLLIAFAWIVPLSWPPHDQTQILTQILPVFLHLLLPIIWLVLISRLVHDESLVGDQQFWLTRPYTWPALLASKVLFLITFVFIPFLVMQCYLLFHAGLHPLAALPSLLLNLLYLILVCFLPFFVLATVTSTFPRLALAIIEAVLYLVVLALLIGKFSGNQSAPPLASPIFGTLYALGLVAILIFQYAKRFTLRARLALLAMPLLLAGIFFALPSGPLFRHTYPLATGSDFPHITFDSTVAQPDPDKGRLYRFDHKALLNLPVQIDGQTPGTVFEGRALSFTLDSTSGTPIHYVSPWLQGGLNGKTLTLMLPENLVDQIKDSTVRLHITLAAERFTRSIPETVTVAEHFNVPGDGTCLTPEDIGNPVCRFAVNAPPVTQFSGPYSPQPCLMTTVPVASRPTGTGRFRIGPQILAFDPVVQDVISLQDLRAAPNQPVNAFACTGTQLSFTQLRAAGRFSVEIEVPSIPLRRYVMSLPERSIGGIAPQ